MCLPFFATGIILKRQAKPTGAASGRKPRDLAALAGSVQKLCQVALPLARSLEFLQEDVDSMSKEYRWAQSCITANSTSGWARGCSHYRLGHEW